MKKNLPPFFVPFCEERRQDTVLIFTYMKTIILK